MLLPRLGPIVQIGYVVENLEASVRRWIETAGVGPWTLFTNVMMQGVYRGEATSVGMNVGLAYQNNVQIELIEQTNKAKSPYRDPAGAPIIGAHHIAWLVDDLDAALANAQQMSLVFRAENPTTRVAYLEAPGEAGVRYELIESEMTAGLIKSGIEATRNWDGANPIQVIDLGGG